MSIYRTQKMQPRNGHTLVVLNPNRISGSATQKDVSLEDQHEHAQEVIQEINDGDKVDYRVIATKGKGELNTRPELKEIEIALRSREIDVMIVEDLGRLIRGTEANRLCGIAVDHGTRVIAIHDCIDTWDDGWEEDVIAACRDHVGHNAHTSKRLKKKLMLRFKRKGAATPCPIAGYVKPEGAKTYFDWFVDEAMKPKILDGAKLLREQLNCSVVADSFNTVGLPVGVYCENKTWDGAMVRRYFENPILKGKPERGNMHSVKHHETGRRRSVRNPEGPVSIEVPNLQILTELEFDEVNALLELKNANRGRKPYANGQDPLVGIPRKRTRFPGQHARCWYCGRIYVWGGNGIKDNLQCTGSRSYKCWNSIGVNGPMLCALVVDAITSMLAQLQGFEAEFQEILESESVLPDEGLKSKQAQVDAEERAINRAKQNFLDAVAMYGPSEDIQKRLDELKVKESELLVRKAALNRQSHSSIDLPGSPAELAVLLKEKFLSLAIDSYEFGAMLPKTVPELFVHAVRLCTGGPLLPRVSFKVDLSGAFESSVPQELARLLVQKFTVDVFEKPKSDLLRSKICELASRELSLKRIASSLTTPASVRLIHRSLELQSTMDELNMDDPYVLQLSPPDDLKKLRRHRHPRYSFSLDEGYAQPQL